jgi:dipeptidyl aminopeptidase/acylaminoacyl peptidase
MRLFLLLFLINFSLNAQKANFKAAEKFSQKNLNKMLKTTRVTPKWFHESDKFWYSYTTTDGKHFYVVDPIRKSRVKMFDNLDFASKLSELTRNPVNHNDLDLDDLELEEDNKTLTFSLDSIEYKYNILSKSLIKGDSVNEEDDNEWARYSPDSTYMVFAKNYNLFLMEVGDEDSLEIQLTEDGEKWFSYQQRNGDTTSDKRLRSNAYWFKDSKKLYANRSDSRKVDDLFVINTLKKPRPELEVYKYAMPGEMNVPQEVLEIFDVETKERLPIEIDKYIDQTISLHLPLKTSERLYMTRMNRSSDTLDISYIDTSNGSINFLFEDVNRPYFNWNYRQLAVINEGKELIYWSEKNGWGQLYLYDGNTGRLKNKITNGGYFITGRIQDIDTLKRKVYYQAFGKEKNVDPYYSMIYSSNFDGTGMRLITSEKYNHRTNFSESSKFFVDNFSAVDHIPESILKDALGNTIMKLEEADLSLLTHAGWKMPERFMVKADDGITNLYGVMYKPFDFDPNKKYPVISYVYPGPQVESFTNDFTISGRYNTALAQLGFIVVSMGHRGGSPMRSKYYHTFGYQNLRDYALADDKRSLEQLAERHSWINLDKIGIFGHSGGGFMSTAALLSYPDFYDVACSSAGNHDNNIYNKWWSETHNGVKAVYKKKKKDDEEDGEKEELSWEAKIENNQSLAKNLKGHLLLTHGNIDNNVHPTNTLRVADELIKAGKRFDMLIFPGKRHGYGNYRGYYEKMMWYYFSEHLLGDYRNNVDIDLPDSQD